MIEFKIIDAADQQFGAILSGRRCTIRLRINALVNRWAFDFALDDEWVLHGQRIVLGTDLLGAYSFDVGSIYCLTDKENDTAVPGYEELVTGIVRLYHVAEDEIEAFLNGTVSS